MPNKRRSFKPRIVMVVAFLAILLALVALGTILILRELNRTQVQQNTPPLCHRAFPYRGAVRLSRQFPAGPRHRHRPKPDLPR